MTHIRNSSSRMKKILSELSSMLKFFVSVYFGHNYFNFKGRASRKELWSVALLKIPLLTLPILGIMLLFEDYADYIELITELYVLVPETALMVRRFHDIDMNPLWSLLIIPLVFLPIFKGDRKDNRYGKNIYKT